MAAAGAALAFLLAVSGLTARIDLLLYDLAARAWTPPPEEAIPDHIGSDSGIAVVAIDETSLARMGRFPWSRRFYAGLLDGLAAEGVRAVAFDIIFNEPQSDDTGADAAFAAAIERFGPVVLPVLDPPSPQGRPVPPLALFVEHGALTGRVGFIADADGVVRRLPRATDCAAAPVPPMLTQVLLEAAGGAGHSPDGDLVPFSARSRILVLPFAAVLEGRVEPGLLEGRLVLVGATAPGLAPTFATPIGGSAERLPGVLVHAHMLQALRAGVMWRRIAVAPHAVLSAAIVAAIVLGFGSIGASVALSAIVAPALIVLAAMLLQIQGVWFPPAPALVAATVCLVAWTTLLGLEMQRRAAAERARAAMTLRAIGDAVIAVDAEERVDYVNPAGAELIGWESHLAQGRAVAELFRLETRGAVVTSADALFAMTDGTRTRLVDRRDRRHEVEVSSARIVDESGRPAGCVVVLRDVTAQDAAARRLRRSEARRQELERELQHAARVSTMGEISAAIAHELTQPLAAIASYAAACRRLMTSDDAAARERLAQTLPKIAAQAERAGDVIRGLRRLFEKSRPVRERLDLAVVVREALTLATLGADRSLAVRMDVEAELPALRIDRVQIQQVVLNLVRNAIEAMAGRKAQHLTLRLRREAAMVAVDVADDGPGLSADRRARLFEPFSSDKPGGLGLGLSISRSIVEAHGGRLTAGPGESGGMLFTFTLPAGTAHDA